MPPLVIDASALVDRLLRTDRARPVEAAMADLDWVAPEVIDVEVVSAIRRRERGREITSERGHEALDALVAAPIERFPHRPLVPVMWSLRHNVTAADATYVALARALGCPLLTTDRRLAATPGLGVTVTLVA
jgi:predicted nucleic acid-binding protein